MHIRSDSLTLSSDPHSRSRCQTRTASVDSSPTQPWINLPLTRLHVTTLHHHVTKSAHSRIRPERSPEINFTFGYPGQPLPPFLSPLLPLFILYPPVSYPLKHVRHSTSPWRRVRKSHLPCNELDPAKPHEALHECRLLSLQERPLPWHHLYWIAKHHRDGADRRLGMEGIRGV